MTQTSGTIAAPDSLDIHFTGFKTGFDAPAAAAALRKLFGISLEKAHAIVAKPGVIKRNVPRGEVKRWVVALSGAGLAVRVFPAAASGKTAAEPAPAALDIAWFQRAIPLPLARERVSIGYAAGLASVMVLSLCMPLLYAGLTAAAGALLLLHLQTAAGLTGQANVLASALWLIGPAFMLGVLLLFLLKPLFTRYRDDALMPLKRADAPGLFALIEVLAERIGTPVPRGVFVNTEANAMVSAARGLGSLRRGELHLVIGLPLVAGLQGRQLAGVLAHEFGHFAQRQAMFAYYVVNSVNRWLHNRAYEEDAMDRRLASWIHEDQIPLVAIIVNLTQALLWLVRRLFALLLALNTRITLFMSRQMEYDADRYESRIGGSGLFHETALDLRELELACAKAAAANRTAWHEAQLLEDLPAAVETLRAGLNEQERRAIRTDMQALQTRHHDTHPADIDRIRHAEARGDVAVMTESFEPRRLFRDFPGLCKRATLWEYKRNGLRDAAAYLQPNVRLLRQNASRETAGDALRAFFGSPLAGRVMDLCMPDNGEHRQLGHQQTVDTLRRLLPEWLAAGEAADKLNERIDVMHLGRRMAAAGIAIRHDAFHLPAEGDGLAAISTATAQLRQTLSQLATADRLHYQRILFALENMPATERDICRRMLEQLAQCGSASGAWRELQLEVYVLNGLLHYLDEDAEDAALLRLAGSARREVAAAGGRFLAMLESIPNALPGADNESNLREFAEHWAGTTLPLDVQAPAHDLADATGRVCESFFYQYSRVLGELARRCTDSEHRAGIRPLRLVGNAAASSIKKDGGDNLTP